MYIDITEFPAGLAELLGTTAAIGGILLSLGVFVLSCVPVVFILRGSSRALVPITFLAVVEAMAFGLLVWLDWWVVILAIMGVVGVYALLAGKILGG